MKIAREIDNGRRRQNGFSLLEVVVATGIMAGALVTLGQLLALSVSNNRAAHALTYTAVLAEQKMEQLRSLAWGFTGLGLPITDTETDGTGLTPSPPDALTSNVDGWVDYIDRFGNALGGGPNPPAKTVYIRRWSIERLADNPDNTIVMHVLVTPRMNRGAADVPGSTLRLPGESRLVSVKTRKAP
jgi:type II secretory pathway pseudopilin PulG